MQTKTCTTCNVEKALTEFYKDKDGKYGVKSRCKECIKELVREYQRRPEVRERKREHLRRPEVQERKREYQRKYRQRPESRRHMREYMSEYLKRSYVLDRKRRRENENYRLRKELGLVSNKNIEVTEKYATRKGRWSDAEVKFLMTSELSLVNIALELGRTYRSVYEKRQKVRKLQDSQ